MKGTIKFNRQQKADFVSTLRKRVNLHFSETDSTRKANGFMFRKIAFYVSGLVLSYVGLLLAENFVVSILLWISVGFFTAFSALNICHDAIHGSISKNQKVNRLFSNLFNLMGANDYVWEYAHNKVHHSYTNVQDHDEDVDAIPFVRTSPHQKHKPYHRFQALYAFPLYGLATISWVFVKDYVKMAKGQIGQTKMPQDRKQIRKMLMYKAAYYLIFLVLPLIVLPFSPLLILAGFFAMHFVEGFTIGVIFMLAHLVDKVEFPLPDETGTLENNWAAHQLITTANFAQKSKLVGFVTGGLNFQVEHHLFPDICHVHYPAISKIVEDTAREHGLPYHTNPTLVKALKSHIKFLNTMGKNR